MESLLALINNFIAIINEASPWLLLGLIIAGLMKSMVPTQVLSQHLGEGKMAIVKAAFIGAPLPLCSCGVIPVATQLHRSGASSPATSSFLVATPETGVDSVSVSYALLGPVMAIYRPIAAITSAIFTGLLVDRGTKTDNGRVNERINETPTVISTEVNTGLNETPTVTSSEKTGYQHSQTSCCASHSEAEYINQTAKDVATEQALIVEENSCCASNTIAVADTIPSLLTKFTTGLRYAFTQLLDDLIVWLLVGLVFATLIRTFLPADFLLQYGSGIVAMLLMILISVPMYICATASTPLAAGLIMAGISPGTALVFMMAGPATNISTLGVIRNEMGGRVLTLYLSGIIVSSIAFGLGIDYALSYLDISIHEQMSHSHEILPIWFASACSILLLLSAIKPLRKRILNA